jgi:hypothetical protein
MLTRGFLPALALLVAAGLCFTGAAPLPKERQPKAVAAEEVAEPLKADKDDEAIFRSVSEGHLKQLGLAVINFSDTNAVMPHNIADKNGKPLLSWRVLILRYIEQDELYKQFKLDEPWDSEHNLKLLEKMPKIYASPRVKLKGAGFTVYQGFAGTGTVFDPGQQVKYPASITDGTANTIMLVESSVAVPWTKPADLPFDATKELPAFGKAFGEKPLTVLCDGTVRELDLKKLTPMTLKSAITRAGGEVLGADW